MSQKINIYNPLTNKESKIDPYGRTAKNIYKYMIVGQGVDSDTILPDDLTFINNRFVRVKTIEDLSNVRRITYAKAEASNASFDSTTYARNIMKAYKGQTIKVVKRWTQAEGAGLDFEEIEKLEKLIKQGKASELGYYSLTEMQGTEIFTIPENGFSSWWKKHSIFFWINSDSELFGDFNRLFVEDPKLQAQLLILTLDKVNKEDVNQYFLDGITNCFFTPIKEWAMECEETSKSKSAQYRYKTINKKVDKYIVKYAKGIPEEDMSDVCNDLQISVEIDLPSTMLNKTKYIEVESQKKSLKKFRYINTRLNHIELNQVNTKDNYEEVDKKTINKIKEVATENKEFILWKESKQGVTQVNTLDKIYKLKDVGGYGEIVKEFQEKYNFTDYKIEKNKNPELTKFLDVSLNCNQSMTFLPDDIDSETTQEWFSDNPVMNMREEAQRLRDGYYPLMDKDSDTYKDKIKVYDWLEECDNLNHIDIRKAYANGHKCSQYQGYLGKITDFRNTDKIVGLGIYQVSNINFNGCESVKKMKCFHDGNNYPSPELEYYRGLGITFDIVRGCWGSSFDFEFTDDMYKKEGGVSHYCKWYGCLMKITEKDRYNFNCDKIEFAKLNAYKSQSDIRYNHHQEILLSFLSLSILYRVLCSYYSFRTGY
jgi:hypothetical protein